MSRPGRVDALEGLRGYAALLVFCVHLFGYLGGRLYDLPPTGEAWPSVQGAADGLLVFLGHANYGVDLFFVLSGYLMARLALRRWPGAQPFLHRRWLRVYPAYAASVGFALAVSWWLGRTYGAGEILFNAVLLQGFFVLGVAAVNPVTWSLTYEAVFYLAVPLLARVREVPRINEAWRVALAVGIVMPLFLAMGIDSEKAVYFAYFSLFAPGVALGFLAAPERERIARETPLGLVVAAWIAFTLANKLEWLSNANLLYYPLSALACGLVLAKALDSTGTLARLLGARWVLWLGRYSYSFFLVHFMVLQVVGELLARTLGTGSRGTYAAAFVVAGTLASLAAALLLFAVAERFYFKDEAARQPARA